MLKRILAFALLAVLLLGLIAPAVYATEETEEAKEAEETIGGWLSDDFYWELEDGTLTITGEGTMPGEAPWKDYAEKIENLYFDGNIYTVHAGAFRGCENLEEIQFSSVLSEIGEYAFEGCASIEEIRLPDTFRKFGAMCFSGCPNLKEVYCEGYMPRFSEACLWNEERIYVFYTPERAWKLDDIKPLEKVYGGRLEFICQDGTDPIPNGEDEPEPPIPERKEPETVPTEAPTVPTTAATEPPTEPTVPETTVPETTVPATTEPVVVLEETVPEPTVQLMAPTEPAEEIIQEETVKGGFVGLVLIVGVLTFFIVGALVFKIRSRNGRY